MAEKLVIWGDTIPLNKARSKFSDMTLTKSPKPYVYLRWAQWVFGRKLQKDNIGMDDYVRLTQIDAGQVADTYTDCPTITPYVVPGSKQAVVVAPGGGFCMVSTEPEGTHPAKFLNDAGISAFVLNYRLEPYRWPVPAIDVQRAIRWVRAHLDEYGISGAKVGAMGYSAGGYAVASEAAFLGDDPVSYDSYQPDDIDWEYGRPDFLVTIYPVSHFEDNPNMLACLKGPEVYTDAAKHEKWMKEYSLIEHFDKIADLPQFMCYGTKDPLKGHEKYAAKILDADEIVGGEAQGANASQQDKAAGSRDAVRPHRRNHVEVLVGAGHGFSGARRWSDWEPKLVDWILEQN